MTSALQSRSESLISGKQQISSDYHPIYTTDTEGEEIHPKLFVRQGTASVNVVDCGETLVMLDSGKATESEELIRAVRNWRPNFPVSDIVLSHHHLDHVGGTHAIEEEAISRDWPPPRIIGHALMEENFVRYERTCGLNAAINRRQSLVDGPRSWPQQYRGPDLTYTDHYSFRRGDQRFECHHARGETDDHTWTWMPDIGALHTGDLIIWAVPNGGNPQKVQRFVGEWSKALQTMALKEAEILLPGHGLPIFGQEMVRQVLTDTAELLESVEHQVLESLNRGVTLDECLERIIWREDLLARPYLRPVYDHPEFLVRNVWRQYAGWYDGQPDHLLPAPRWEQAAEWIALAGGVSNVTARATILCARGEFRLARHLIEMAVLCSPDSEEIHSTRARIYDASAADEESSIARHILRHAANSSRRGVRDLASADLQSGPELDGKTSSRSVL
jgi:alkyl sulfatase BDS1-like metallo-beta-lactamase superfamily hydrolase